MSPRHGCARFSILAVAPRVEVRILENTGHFPLWKQRERFVRELLDVLERYATG